MGATSPRRTSHDATLRFGLSMAEKVGPYQLPSTTSILPTASRPKTHWQARRGIAVPPQGDGGVDWLGAVAFAFELCSITFIPHVGHCVPLRGSTCRSIGSS